MATWEFKLAGRIFDVTDESFSDQSHIIASLAFILCDGDAFFTTESMLHRLFMRNPHGRDIIFSDRAYRENATTNIDILMGLKLLGNNMIELADHIKMKNGADNEDILKCLVNAYIYEEFPMYLRQQEEIGGPVLYPHGMKKSILIIGETLHKLEYSSSMMDCCICLMPFHVDDHIVCSRMCDHYFHKNCMVFWLCDEQRKFCPNCRGIYSIETDFPQWIKDIPMVDKLLSIYSGRKLFTPDMIKTPFQFSLILQMFNFIILEFLHNFGLTSIEKNLESQILKETRERAYEFLSEYEQDGTENEKKLVADSILYIEEHFRMEPHGETTQKSLEDAICQFYDRFSNVSNVGPPFFETFINDFVPNMMGLYKLSDEDIASYKSKFSELLSDTELYAEVFDCDQMVMLSNIMLGDTYVNKAEERLQLNWNSSINGCCKSLSRLVISVPTQSSVEPAPLADTIVHKKAAACAKVVKKLNRLRVKGKHYEAAKALKTSADSNLEFDLSGEQSVNMLRIWDLITNLVLPTMPMTPLSIRALKHLESLYDAKIKLDSSEVPDVDAVDASLQSNINTTWKQIFLFMRSGNHQIAIDVAKNSSVSKEFSHLLCEYVKFREGGVTEKIATLALERCEEMLQATSYDKEKLLLHAIISGSRSLIQRLLGELRTILDTPEDLVWFLLSSVRESSYGSSSSSVVLNCGATSYYSLEDLQEHVNKLAPLYCTKNGKDPLVYPYILFLSIQLLPGILHLWKNIGRNEYSVDLVHICILLADNGVLSKGSGSKLFFGVVNALADASAIIKHYGDVYLRQGNLRMALEYFVQAAAAFSGGELSWFTEFPSYHERIGRLMIYLKEIIAHDDGVSLLLGSRGAGEKGLLRRLVTNEAAQTLYLRKSVIYCQRAGLYKQAIEIQKRIGAFSDALDTTNMCLSEALCASSYGTPDSESKITSHLQTGKQILRAFKSYPKISSEEKAEVYEQKKVRRQLRKIYEVCTLTRSGNEIAALKMIAKLVIHPHDRTLADFWISPHVKACVPILLKEAIHCLEKVNDRDGSLREIRAEVKRFVTHDEVSEMVDGQDYELVDGQDYDHT